MDVLSDIKRLNLYSLMCMRDMARADIAAAIVRFGVSREALQRIGTMPPHCLLELVQRVGERSLFKPCVDIAVLLDRAEGSASAGHLTADTPTIAKVRKG
ncbi:flagellar transcriptional regulator FlhD [Azohydromonas aeria]|uniref:flagellar transcriptional regulator FlhD n=1 Tax=Azohydromonas aeria TaxID=2590212 RepID=UPI0012F7F8E1|nr:flagellar transcriptional regulator FlhD [Azohydromonas aeria]